MYSNNFFRHKPRKAKKEDKPPVLEPEPQVPDNPPDLLKMEPNAEEEKQEQQAETPPPRRMTRRLSAINSKAELANTKSDQERQEARRRPAVRHSRRIASLSSLPSTPSCSPPAIAMEAPEFPSSPSILVMEESTKEDSPTRSQPKDIPAPTEEVKDTPSEESEKQLHPLLENLKLLTKDAHYDGRIPPCKVYGGIHLLRLFGEFRIRS